MKFFKKNIMKRKLLKILFVLCVNIGFAQTTLEIGDIVLNTINASSAEDSFSFVPLVNLEAGTVINFTNNEWDTVEEELSVTESAISWAATEAVSAGTSVEILTVNTSPVTNIGYVSGVLILADSDNIFTFQGDITAPSFLHIFSTKSIDLPAGLISFTTMVQGAVTSGNKNFQYNCSFKVGTKAQLFYKFSQLPSFNSTVATLFDLSVNCDLTVSDANVVDTTAPSLLSTTPLDDAKEIALDSDIQLVFDENVLSGLGAITLKNSFDDSIVETFVFTDLGVSPEGITILGPAVAISLTSDLLINTSYYLEIGNQLFGDQALNLFTGISDKTTFNFSVIKEIPVVVSHTPTSGQEDVLVSTSISIIFDIPIELVPETTESIEVGSNSIALTDSQISISGSTLTINPSSGLEFGTSYTIVLPDNGIQGIDAGVFVRTSFGFETKCGPNKEKKAMGECVSSGGGSGSLKIPDGNLAIILEELGHYNISTNELLDEEALTKLVISNKEIDSIVGLHLFPNLEIIECEGNKIEKILGNFPSLKFLNCSNNLIDSLNVNGSNNLKWLICNDNNIKSLNLSTLSSLRGIDCSNNILESLNIKNGKNSEFDIKEYIDASGNSLNEVEDNNIMVFNALGNVDLECIVVDDPTTSLGEWDNYIDDISTSNFTKTDCQQLAIEDVAFEEFLVNKKIDNVVDGFVLASNLSCINSLVINQEDHSISNLILSEYFTELTSLTITSFANENTIKAINIENLPKLVILNISHLSNIESIVLDAEKINTLNISYSSMEGPLFLDKQLELEQLSLYAVSGVTSLDLSKNIDIRQLSLTSTGSELTSIDLSNNIALDNLYLFNTDFTSLNLSTNASLKLLDIENTPIESLNLLGTIDINRIILKNTDLTLLDLSENKKLTDVIIESAGELSSVNTSGLKELEELNLTYLPDLLNIDVSTNTNLLYLDVNQTGLTMLNVSENLLLTNLNAKSTSLSTIDLSSNLDLKYLSIDLDQLSVSENLKLEYLDVSESQISALVLGGNPLLISLDAHNTKLENGIDLSNNVNLNILNLNNTAVGAIDVSNNTKLTKLYLSKTNISELDISKCPSLSIVDISDNSISELMTHKNKSLASLHCEFNSIAELDLKLNTNLSRLDASDNHLSNLDLSMNKYLHYIDLKNNDLETINLKNGIGNGSLINVIDLTDNNLSCVFVNDYVYSASNWLKIDEGVDFIEEGNCGDNKYIFIEDDNFEQALIDLGYDDILDGEIIHHNVKGVSKLNISDKNISNLIGIEAFSSLDTLYASDNLITTFDFSITPNLLDIDLSNNRLVSVDIPEFSKLLKNINLSNNELESLIFLRQATSYNPQTPSYYFESFNVEENTNLHCVSVKDTLYFSANAIASNPTIFSQDCNKEVFKKISIDDANFEQVLVDLEIDDVVDGFVLNDSIVKVKSLDVSNKNINSLIGINYFKKLRILNCSFNELDKLDLSKLERLDSLNCKFSSINDIKLFNSLESNEGLIKMNISNNYIYDLDFESLGLLEVIDASSNGFLDVDLSENLNLKELNFSDNSLESMNMKNGMNSLITGAYFDITSNSEDFICVWVDSLEYSTEKWINKDINVVYSESQCGELTDFVDPVFEGMYDDFNDGKVLTSDVSIVEKIERIYHYDEEENDNISDFTGLVDFSSLNEMTIKGKRAKIIDFSDNDYLQKLLIMDCDSLLSIDISGLTNLKELSILNNSKLTAIDISNNKDLVSIVITGNSLLEDLDFGDGQNLEFVSVVCNNLKSLDLSKQLNLQSVYGFGNDLETLNMKSGTNVLINDFYFTENENLLCIEVDDTNYSAVNWINIDGASNFSSNCLLSVAGVSPDGLVKLFVVDGKITSSDVSLRLEIMNLYGQQISNNNLPVGIYITRVISLTGDVFVQKVLVK